MGVDRLEGTSSARAAQVDTDGHLTIAERTARGKAERGDVPRRLHGEWRPPSARPDPVSLLEEQSASRVPELVPIRYGRMLASPFAFFRGAAYLMASDLSSSTRTALHVQLCGDAHLSNFGAFAAPDRRLVFGLNDFDETLPGPFEWDLKRLVASFAVAGRERGFDAKTRASIITAVSRAYREDVQALARTHTLDVWYSRVDADEVAKQFEAQASKSETKRLDKDLEKARLRDTLAAFDKLTTEVDGERRIMSAPPLIVPLEELDPSGGANEAHAAVRQLIGSYRRTLPADRRKLLERFRYADAARKVVGVGSVGTEAWIVLMLGSDESDPLFLQAKEADASVLEPFLGKSEFGTHGQRVVEGQRLMQAASDIMLGWLHATGLDGVQRDFYIRQLWDSKGSVDVETMEPDGMAAYGRLCGSALALAHSRSGDPVAIASYLGTGHQLDTSLAAFAETYADQNERDFDALRSAVESGRVVAETGV
jgi:uncharacterized protein (DUF2252 family)